METTIFTLTDLDADFWITSACIVALLVLSAFFSGSETALTAASRGKLHGLAEQGSRGAKRALSLTDNNERLIGSVLLGNNLVNILATALATGLFTRLFGVNGVAYATLVMTLLVLIFAEVLPKTYAITKAESAATLVASPIRIVVIVLSPIVAAVQLLVRIILTAFGVNMTAGDEIDAAQVEIAGAISLGHIEGNFRKDDRDRLLGALDLKDREVEEIMLHRSDIEMINADDDPQDIVRNCLESAYTRIPIYKDDTENIVGVLHSKDLLRAVEKLLRNADNRQTAMSKLKIMDIAMKPYFVPETTTLNDQMHQFLRRRSHFALVVDEYGALQGLITLEDILEEIVGEITDEHDQEETSDIQADASGNFEVDGAATIRDLNRSYDWDLPDDEANTVAGLVIHEAQMIPIEGQVFSFHGYRFQIVKREQNRIIKLKVRPL
jgi:Mg2+/Co2+ transporter CorB